MVTAAGQVGAAGAQDVSRRSVEPFASVADPISADPKGVSAALEAWRGMLSMQPVDAFWKLARTQKPACVEIPAQSDTAELWTAIESLKNRLDDAERKFGAAEQELIAHDALKQSQQQAASDRNRLRQVERTPVELQIELTRARVHREKAESIAAAAKTQVAVLTAQLLALRSINARPRLSRSGRF